MGPVLGGLSAQRERCPSSRKGLIENCGFASANAVAQRRLHCGTGLQGTEHVNGGDGFPCQLGRDICCDHRQPEHLDVKRLAGRLHGLQVLPAVLAQAEVELVPSNGLLDGVAVAIELIADRRSDEVGAVGVKTLLHQEVDVAEIDIAEIDRDLLAVSPFRPKLMYLACHFYHPYTIHTDGIWNTPAGVARGAPK